MGKKVVHCGGPGAGQAAKICNNMILGVSMIAVSEAFVLAESLGLSHQALYAELCAAYTERAGATEDFSGIVRTIRDRSGEQAPSTDPRPSMR